MSRKSAILISVSVFLATFFFLNLSVAEAQLIDTGVKVWEECPDWGARRTSSTTLLNADELDRICGDDLGKLSLGNSYDLVFNWLDAPHEGMLIDDKDVIIVGEPQLNIEARGCSNCGVSCGGQKSIYTKFFSVWSYQNGYVYSLDDSHTFNKDYYEKVNISLDNITDIGGEYRVRIDNDQGTGCLWIDYVGLKIDYYLFGNVGEVNNTMSIDRHSIPKYSSFRVEGNVTCIGGPCGTVASHLEYYNGTDWRKILAYPSSDRLVIPGLYTSRFCADMNHEAGESPPYCEFSWDVSGMRAGNYLIRMVSQPTSGGIITVTNSVMTSVNTGYLDMTSAIQSNQINLGDAPIRLDVDVDCNGNYGTPCGNVSLLIIYKDEYGSIFTLGSSGNLSTSNTNPISCDNQNPLVAGDSCYTKTWFISGNEPGDYQIIAFVYADDGDVANITNDHQLKVNPGQTVGKLSVTNVLVQPDNIYVSGTATLQGDIICSDEYCGDVTVYARSYGQDITSNGLSTFNNPRTCSDMKIGSSCNTYWNLTGNDAGTYSLDILANSNQTGVTTQTSTTTELNVTSPVGDIDILTGSFVFDDSSVDEGDIVGLNAIVTCSSDYCGEISGLIEYNTSGISTQYTNLYQCEPTYGFSCGLFWNIDADKVGSYTVILSVTSNESTKMKNDSANLIVNDPNNPKPAVSVTLGSLMDSYNLGSNIILNGDVTCGGEGDCGSVNAYSKYSDGSWNNIGSNTPLSTTEQNPKTISLSNGQTIQIQWQINADSVGTYDIGMLVDAVNPGVIDSQSPISKSIEVIETVDIDINIQSPSKGREFSRGDEILLKAGVTKNDYPLSGASVTVSAEGMFLSEQLDETGNGIYSKTIEVGDAVDRGSYVVTFYVNDGSQTFSETSNVYINPEMDVSVETEKNIYEILEKVKMQGQVLKGGKAVKASVNIMLVCPSRSFMDVTIDTDSSGNYLYEYLISMATPAEVCTFELDTEDGNGNYNFTSKKVSIVPSESEVYKISFFSPAPDSRYKKGDSVKIRVEVTYGGDPLEGAEVLCLNPMFENIQLSHIGSGAYETDYIVDKESPSDIWILTCVASTPDEQFGRKSVNVYITPLELKLEKISPTQTSFQVGDVAKISLDLKYPDNSPLEDATVYIKRGSEIIYLNETIPGTYEGEYEVKEQGVYNFDVYAEDQFGNVGAFPGEIILTAGFSPFSLYWFILPFIVAVAALAGVVWKRGRREVIIKEEPAKAKVDRREELQNKIKETERKIGDIEKAKDEVEKEYYERKIDEKTFNRMIQNYEQDRIRLNVELESLKKEFQGLPG